MNYTIKSLPWDKFIKVILPYSPILLQGYKTITSVPRIKVNKTMHLPVSGQRRPIIKVNVSLQHECISALGILKHTIAPYSGRNAPYSRLTIIHPNSSYNPQYSKYESTTNPISRKACTCLNGFGSLANYPKLNFKSPSILCNNDIS